MEALGWPQLLRNSANRTKIQQNCISGPRKANKNKACSTKIILGGWPGWLCGENVVSRSLPGIPWAIPGCHYSRVLRTQRRRPHLYNTRGGSASRRFHGRWRALVSVEESMGGRGAVFGKAKQASGSQGRGGEVGTMAG